MKVKFNEDLLIGIYIDTDDWCQIIEKWMKNKALGSAHSRRREPGLTTSEIVTILIFYHYSGMKTFKHYYTQMVLPGMISHFPELVSYDRFVALIPRYFPVLMSISSIKAIENTSTGFSFIDSKKLPVCHNCRIHSHKVFKGIAQRGKSSTGWFYGSKIHLVINHLGDILRFQITAGNVADNNPDVLQKLLHNLKGKVFGDKGYISSLAEQFYQQGVHLVTKLRSNMKNKLMHLEDRMMLKKRAIIETVFGLLMSVLDIDHTRHRSPVNAFCHLLAGVVAYHHYSNKPKAILDRFINQ
jgi:hypothetical protein